MFNTFRNSLKNPFTIIGSPYQVEGIERNHNALEGLLHISVAGGGLPDLLSKLQMTLEECFKIFYLRFTLRLVNDGVKNNGPILFAGSLRRQRKCEWLQFNADLKKICRASSAVRVVTIVPVNGVRCRKP